MTVEDEKPKTTPASVGSDITEAELQADGIAVQSKYRKPDTNCDATQKARDALFVLDSALGVEKARNQLQNSTSLYITSTDGESQQSRITQPPSNMHQSASAAGSSFSLVHRHNAEWSPPPRDASDGYQSPPKSARLSSRSQELSVPASLALKRCQPNPSTLPMRETGQSASELSAPKGIDKPPQSSPIAEEDHCSSKFGISGTSRGRQTSQSPSIDNPPHYTGLLCPGTVKNDEASTQSYTQGASLLDDLQADLQLPDQASRENMGAGGPWTGSLTSHHKRPAQQLRKLRPDGVGKAPQSQGITPLDPNKLQQSSTGMTSTNDSICQGTRLVNQHLLEQDPYTSLPVSKIPRPALSLSPVPSDFASTVVTTPQVRSIPTRVDHISHQLLRWTKDPSPSHHNTMWMNVITGVFETSRTANDKKRLRDRATELVR